jgi:PAS domain S-box-containing protein
VDHLSGCSGAVTILTAPRHLTVQDYALFLLDTDGNVVTWYAGAEPIYGHKSREVIGRHASFFYPDEDAPRKLLQQQLKKAASEGHAGIEELAREKAWIPILGQPYHYGPAKR